jgi:hypothetical protein
MNKNQLPEKYILMIGVTVALALSIGVFFYLKKESPKVDEPKEILIGNGQPCPGETLELTAQDTHMDGLLKLNQKFKVIINWYACHEIEKGDLVYYRYTPTLDPVVKVVRATEGDKFQVLFDKKHGAWNLKVNDEFVMDAVSDTPFYFGARPPSPLSLYEKANRGVLQKGDLILLSNVPPGSNDSGLFGVANIADVIGKVEVD